MTPADQIRALAEIRQIIGQRPSLLATLDALQAERDEAQRLAASAFTKSEQYREAAVLAEQIQYDTEERAERRLTKALGELHALQADHAALQDALERLVADLETNSEQGAPDYALAALSNTEHAKDKPVIKALAEMEQA